MVVNDDEQRGIPQRVERPPGHDIRALRGPEKKLGKGDWHLVYELFQQTGDLTEIAENSDLKPNEIEHLLYNGLQRLGMPPIFKLIEQNAVNEGLAALADKNQKLVTPEAQNALQERVKRDVEVATQLIEQCVEGGMLLQGYVSAVTQAVIERRCEFIVPPAIGPKFLESLTSSMNKHASALEKAVKTLRLTVGESTENVAHNVGVMLAQCSNEELEEALASSQLPPRLLVRAGAEPIQRDAAGNATRTEPGPAPIEADFDEEDVNISSAGKLELHDDASTVLADQ